MYLQWRSFIRIQMTRVRQGTSSVLVLPLLLLGVATEVSLAHRLEPIELSLDLRVQHVVRDELQKAMATFGAKAAAGLILDVRNGEVLAAVSLPDFDPHTPEDALQADRLDRLSTGVYEMGSTFKALTIALALESGRFSLETVLDATEPLALEGHFIRDFRGKNRPLTVAEAFLHSSNIGMARLALAVGPEEHRNFLKKFGLTGRFETELPSGSPMLPIRWTSLSSATISFGHGLAVTPLQATASVAALINGGTLIRPTFLKDAPMSPRILERSLITAETSAAVRHLLRLNAEVGSARRADVPGYMVGGKTGTAEKVVDGRYSKNRVLASFMAGLPMDEPRYLVLIMLDEPRGTPETFGYRSAGWNAAPVAGNVIKRAMPLLGLLPRRTGPEMGLTAAEAQ